MLNKPNIINAVLPHLSTRNKRALRATSSACRNRVPEQCPKRLKITGERLLKAVSDALLDPGVRGRAQLLDELDRDKIESFMIYPHKVHAAYIAINVFKRLVSFPGDGYTYLQSLVLKGVQESKRNIAGKKRLEKDLIAFLDANTRERAWGVIDFYNILMLFNKTELKRLFDYDYYY